MIIDDHQVFRRAAYDVLNEHPRLNIIGEATHGTNALTLALQLQPDIVVIDVRLPDITGIALTQQLVTALPGVRVVILTFASSDKLIVDAIRAGAAGYLSKDIQPEALIRAIAGVADGEVAMSRRTAARVLAHFRQQSTIETAQSVKLTTREAEVLQLLAQGATDRQIADTLVIAESTAKKHVQHILRKLRVRNRAEAVAKCKYVEH
jgi:DNA-binding NarL/FixJ family response regulator